MRDLKQETSLFVGSLVFIAGEISCSVELSMKKYYNLGARIPENDEDPANMTHGLLYKQPSGKEIYHSIESRSAAFYNSKWKVFVYREYVR